MAMECNDCTFAHDMKTVREDVKEIRKAVIDIRGIQAEIRHLREDYLRLYTENRQEHDDVFNRLRDVEGSKVSRRDIGIVVTIVIAVVGVIGLLVRLAA